MKMTHRKVWALLLCIIGWVPGCKTLPQSDDQQLRCVWDPVPYSFESDWITPERPKEMANGPE